MDDKQIVDLYWERSEKAISETDNKYGSYFRHIAYNILYNQEDAEECVNDTYLRAWNSMPPQRPNRLEIFLGKITRNLSLNRYEAKHAEKRGGGQVACVLDELQECIPDNTDVAHMVEDKAVVEAIDVFLKTLPGKQRKIFVRRYWYMSSIKDIATDYGISESKVKVTLFRVRTALKKCLEKEGIVL